MSRTRFLAAIAVLVLAMQVFPAQAGHIKLLGIGLGVLYLVVRALRTYPAQYRDRKRRAAQDAADRQEYLQYERELASIHTRHGVNGPPGDGALVSQEYKYELSALHHKFQAMLTRKFGPDRVE